MGVGRKGGGTEEVSMKGRYGWLIVGGVVIAWELLANLTDGDSLTFSFRRAITDTAWRWPVLVLTLWLVAHLFMPTQWRQHDPIDRAYDNFHAWIDHQPSDDEPQLDFPEEPHEPVEAGH